MCLSPRRASRWLFLVALGLLLSGCSTGSKKFQVKGRVTSSGQPLRIESQPAHLGRIAVSFFPIGDGDHVAAGMQSAVVNQDDGTFKVEGTDGKGILPGRYRIYIYHYDPMPQDKLKGQFAEGKSQIERDVAGGEEINLEVSTPTG